MCVVIPPMVGAVMGAISSVASAALSIRGQQIQRKTQQQVQERATKAANQRHLVAMSAERARENQEMIAVNQQVQEQTRRVMEAKATARTSAGESSVKGTNVDALLATFTQRYADFRYATHEQARMSAHNRELALQSAGHQYQQTWIDINRPLPQVDYVGAAVGLGKDLTGVARNYSRDLRIQTQQSRPG